MSKWLAITALGLLLTKDGRVNISDANSVITGLLTLRYIAKRNLSP
jgi:hypothetical protein